MADLSPGRVLGRMRRERVPGGRPHRMSVDLSDDELGVLERHAAEAGGITVQKALVELALSSGGETPAVRRELLVQLFALRRDLSGMATNLNQAARRANAGDGFPVEVVREDLLELRRLAGPGGRIDVAIDVVSSGPAA